MIEIRHETFEHRGKICFRTVISEGGQEISIPRESAADAVQLAEDLHRLVYPSRIHGSARVPLE